jgi:hypothetical protein
MMLSLVTANLLWLQLTYSQRASTSFGPISELNLDFIPAGLAIRSAPSLARNEVAVLGQSPASLHFFSLNDSGRIVQSGSYPLSAPRSGLVAADLDGDGEPEFLSLLPDGSELSVLKRNGRSYAEKTYPTPARGQKLTVTDINNDGVPDVLLYGKSVAGVATMLGSAGGGFSPGPELFNELSVSGLIALDINGDGIRDVIVVNWLSNELTLFYGISRMVFSEQLAVRLPGEPENLAFTWMQKRRSYGIAVSLPAMAGVALVRGTPDGDVQVEGTVSLAGRPASLAFADVNDDAIPDLLVATDRGTAVALGSEDFTFLPPVVFGPEASPAGWGPSDLDSDRRTDLAIAGQQPRRLVFLGNARHSSRVRWPATYAVGSGPRSISLLDIDGDGLIDMAVANGGSASVSLLMNKGHGAFDGQLSVPVPDQPMRVTASSTGGAERLILTSHQQTEKIGVVSWGAPGKGTTTSSIPTGSMPYALDAWRNGDELNVLVRNGAHGTSPVSLSLFEQISGRQFLERNLRASLPARISALTVDRSDSDSYNVYFVRTDRLSHQATVSFASAGRDFAIGRIRPLLSYADSSGATCGIIRAALRSATSRDLILCFGKPVNALAVAYGRDDGNFDDTLEWVHNVAVEGESDIIVRDVDQDGWRDLTVRDPQRDAVVTYYGSPDGFQQGREVEGVRGARAIAVAPLVSPDQNDLVVVREESGTVSILRSPFRRHP